MVCINWSKPIVVKNQCICFFSHSFDVIRDVTKSTHQCAAPFIRANCHPNINIGNVYTPAWIDSHLIDVDLFTAILSVCNMKSLMKCTTSISNTICISIIIVPYCLLHSAHLFGSAQQLVKATRVASKLPSNLDASRRACTNFLIQSMYRVDTTSSCIMSVRLFLCTMD